MRNKFILLILCLKVVIATAEENRYVIYLTDKNQSPYAVSEPSEFLSERAIARRTNQNIAITEQDFPVNPTYLTALLEIGIEPIYTSKWLNAVVVQEEDSLLEALDLMFVDHYDLLAPGLRLAETLGDYELESTSQEPMVASKEASFQIESLGVDQMIEEGYNGSGIHIAVFDAGFQAVNTSILFEHLFAGDRMVDYQDFVRNDLDVFSHDDHGTNVLSCIAAEHDDLVGTATAASYALYITEDTDSEYRIEEFNWLIAAERSDSIGIDIISSSLGYNIFDDASMNYTYEDTNGQTTIISQAAKIASEKGVLVVNSAGNEGRNRTWPYVIFPSDVEDILVVGAVDDELKYASFSSIGPTVDDRIKPDVVALGRNVTIYQSNNHIDTRSGTSYSAPLITGFAASLWQKYPEFTNLELKEQILRSGNTHFKPNVEIGHGIPKYQRVGNTVLALSLIMEEMIKVYPNPFTSNHINISIGKEYTSEDVKLSLLSPSGMVINNFVIEKPKKGSEHQVYIDGDEKGIYILTVDYGGQTKKVKLLRY